MTIYKIDEAEMFKALGHPVRLAIAKGLRKKQCNVMKIVKELRAPQSTISQHLGILKRAGVIKGMRDGTAICYQLREGLASRIIDQL